jgi:hypothetical protein
VSWAGQLLAPGDVASPCGIKPQGYFNDSIAIYQNGQAVSIDRNQSVTITAINSNRGPSSESTQWVDPVSTSFKIYMLDSALMTKSRVWGVIRESLQPGSYELLVDNNYQMVNLRIVKGVYLTTSTIIGGKQFFFPLFFGVAALACLLYIIAIKIKFKGYGVLREYQRKNR